MTRMDEERIVTNTVRNEDYENEIEELFVLIEKHIEEFEIAENKINVNIPIFN